MAHASRPTVHGIPFTAHDSIAIAQVARALYQRSSLILADDPLAAVDAETQNILFRAFEAYAAEGRAVVLVMNQIHLVRRCPRVVHMTAGKLAAQGSFAECAAASPAFAAMVSVNGSATEPGEVMVSASGGADTKKDGVVGAAAGDSGGKSATKVETQATGSVSQAVIVKYLRAFGPRYFVVCCIAVQMAWGMMGFNDRWLAYWVEAAEDPAVATSLYIGVYIAGTVSFLVLLVGSSIALQIGGARAARTLHARCIEHVLHAPVSHFEDNSSGALLSRLSSDFANVDHHLAHMGDNFLSFAATIVTIYVLVVFILPEMAVAAAIVSVCTYLQILAIDRSNREVKRMANNAM